MLPEASQHTNNMKALVKKRPEQGIWMDDVAMPEMVVGRRPHVGPLPADEVDQVAFRVLGIAGKDTPIWALCL